MKQANKKNVKKIKVYCPGCHSVEHSTGAYRCSHCREVLVQTVDKTEKRPQDFSKSIKRQLMYGPRTPKEEIL